jgi:hypothetical protein
VQGAGNAPSYDSTTPIEHNSNHSHAFTTGDSTHDHTVNLPAKTSTAGSSHTHTANINLSPFDTSSEGSPNVDVTMPYVQLRACRKD